MLQTTAVKHQQWTEESLIGLKNIELKAILADLGLKKMGTRMFLLIEFWGVKLLMLRQRRSIQSGGIDPRDDSPFLGYNTSALKKKVSSTKKKKKSSTSKALFGDDDEVNSSARTIGSGNSKKKKETNEASASPRRQPTRSAKREGKRY
jgi:hypothetical protein